MNINSNAIQQYVRIALYQIFAALGSYGVVVPDSSRAVILSIAGSLATLAWTIYGTRMNALLDQVKAKTGVKNIIIEVDPELIQPAAVTANTAPGITAKAA